MKKPLLFVCLLRLSSLAVAQSPAIDLTKLSWMIGTWEMKTSGGSIYEVWKTESDSSFLAKNFKIGADQDTMVFETIRLVQRNNNVYYIPTVSNQNNQQPVEFTITSARKNEFIAENKAHDFPQRIGYIRKDDTLEGWIDGQLNGQYAKRTFPFEKRN